MTIYRCTINSNNNVIVWSYEDSIFQLIWKSEQNANDIVVDFDWIWFPVGWRY